MPHENIQFPVYRKYRNNRHFFKIIDSKTFEEKQVIGNKIIVHKMEANRLPELNHINDLLYGYSEFAEVITEEEYDAVK